MQVIGRIKTVQWTSQYAAGFTHANISPLITSLIECKISWCLSFYFAHGSVPTKKKTTKKKTSEEVELANTAKE